MSESDAELPSTCNVKVCSWWYRNGSRLCTDVVLNVCVSAMMMLVTAVYSPLLNGYDF